MTTTPTLALSSHYGSTVIPACAHCGGLTFRLSADRRGCFNCREQTGMIFGNSEWKAVQLVGYKDGMGSQRFLRVTVLA